jgi:RimJ/RimL family protein N-acetyltransferase
MIETERLFIKPLTHDQLLKYIKLDNSLESELNLFQSPRTISHELQEALEQTILPNVADPDKNYLFSTLWTLISKEENKMIGDLCFVGEPDENGQIEIGYGIYKEFRKKGFMSEAMGGMIKWAENQQNIRSIVADTEKSNIDSYSILEKNNFKKVGETETLYNWQFNIQAVDHSL